MHDIYLDNVKVPVLEIPDDGKFHCVVIVTSKEVCTTEGYWVRRAIGEKSTSRGRLVGFYAPKALSKKEIQELYEACKEQLRQVKERNGQA